LYLTKGIALKNFIYVGFGQSKITILAVKSVVTRDLCQEALYV